MTPYSTNANPNSWQLILLGVVLSLNGSLVTSAYFTYDRLNDLKTQLIELHIAISLAENHLDTLKAITNDLIDLQHPTTLNKIAN